MYKYMLVGAEKHLKPHICSPSAGKMTSKHATTTAHQIDARSTAIDVRSTAIDAKRRIFTFGLIMRRSASIRLQNQLLKQ